MGIAEQRGCHASQLFSTGKIKIFRFDFFEIKLHNFDFDNSRLRRFGSKRGCSAAPITNRRLVMIQCMDVEAVTNRLKRIEGQVRGLIKMVAEDKSCEEILIQIGSVKSALHKTGQVIL
ncbi:MAG: metal-sensitive transcriptional regulator, partial [Eubacterium sp.]|nr:metal-sensitive transcriptional regulator [Eubacterium sp.]